MGNGMSNTIIPLRECKYKLIDTIGSYLDSMKNSRKPSEQEENDIQIVLFKPIYESPKQDAFTLQINAAIAELDKIFRPYIK